MPTNGPSIETLKALETAPNMYLVLSPDLYILTASDLYLEATETSREEIAGKHIFEAFPDNPDLPDADGMQNINASLQEVLRTGKPHYMEIQRYDVPDLANPGRFIQRYWDPCHTPVFDEQGEMQYIIQLATNVTGKVLAEQKLQKSSERMQLLNNQLNDANREIDITNRELVETVEALRTLNNSLEYQVKQRTLELEKSIAELAASNRELGEANNELRKAQDDLLLSTARYAESEEILRLAVDAARIGTWHLKPYSKEFKYNATLAHIFGYEGDEPMTFGQIMGQVLSDDKEKISGIGNADGGEGHYDITYAQHRFNDGKIIWVRLLGRISREDENKAPVFTGVAMDVTEQVNASQAVAESEERFRTLADNAGILIGVGDETGKANYFNRAWLELTGKSLEELAGFGWTGVIYPEDKTRYIVAFENAFPGRLAFKEEFRIVNKSGDPRWVLAKNSPRFNADGSFAGYISSCIDITEQKQDEQRKNDFISMVSHELKTPLTSLSAYIQMVAKFNKNSDGFTSEALLKAIKQVNKMTTMINGFLNVSRIESGRLHVDLQYFDLADLVRETQDETKSAISSHNIIFAPVQPTLVLADKDKIGHIVNNLISNAVKYSPGGSIIQVACITVGETALISVKDEGIGVRPEDRERIFERFFRSEGPEMKSISGFGIGLYLCRDIVERHEGKIWVESEIGKGSTFKFSLPVRPVQ